MSTLTLENISKYFGAVPVIKNLSLEVSDGEFCVLVGPSGCGKSTLLRLIAGLDSTSSGRILIDGKDVSDAEPSERGIAMVFQSYALYPHMNVFRNMGFALEMASVAKPEIRERVHLAAEKLRLGDYLLRRPRELSGGQRQRVAIGRAITRKPGIFLLDEPLSNLDAALRVATRVEIARLKAELASTMIYVTHDQIEAMTLADRIVVMNAGVIAQVGTPLELYDAPANLFVAGFIGSPAMNILKGRVSGSDAAGETIRLVQGLDLKVPGRIGAALGAEIRVGIRPEHILLSEVGGEAHFDGTAAVVELLGSDTFIHMQERGEAIVIRDRQAQRVRTGERVRVTIPRAACHFFDNDGVRLQPKPQS